MATATPKPGAELVRLEPETFALARLDDTDITEVLRDNMGEHGGLRVFDLDRVKIPAGGGKLWSVPGLMGDEDTRELVGVIVNWRDPRSYWSVDIEDGDGSQPPDCQSNDGVLGTGLYGKDSEGNPSGECATCPMSQWGSKIKDGKPTNAQACKQMRLLFLLRSDDLLPLAIFMPPTSLQPIKRYFLRLSAKGIPYHGVLTKLTLGEAANKAGVKFSQAQAEMVGRLDPESHTMIRNYAAGLADALSAVSLDAEVAADADAPSAFADQSGGSSGPGAPPSPADGDLPPGADA